MWTKHFFEVNSLEKRRPAKSNQCNDWYTSTATPSVVSWFKRRHLPTSLIEIGFGVGTLPPPVVLILKVAWTIANCFNQLGQSFFEVWSPQNKNYSWKWFFAYQSQFKRHIILTTWVFPSTLTSLVKNNCIRRSVGTKCIWSAGTVFDQLNQMTWKKVHNHHHHLCNYLDHHHHHCWHHRHHHPAPLPHPRDKQVAGLSAVDDLGAKVRWLLPHNPDTTSGQEREETFSNQANLQIPTATSLLHPTKTKHVLPLTNALVLISWSGYLPVE